MHLEEDGTERPLTASDIPSERRISEAWLDFATGPLNSDRSARTPRVGYKKAIPRASARYTLNPGLFEAWGANETGFDLKLVRSGSTASTSTMFPLDDNAAIAAAIPEVPITRTWASPESSNASVHIPSTCESPSSR